MGGVDSLIDSLEFNINNPSSLAKLQLTNYHVGTFYKSSSISNNLNTDKFNSANINYIAIGIPTKKFGFGFGILPYSSVGYRIETLDSATEGQNVLNRYEGEGGINQAFLSVGLPLTSFFSIGVSAQYNFGNLFYRTGQFIEGVDTGTLLTNQSSISGLNYQYSAQVNIPIKRKYLLQGMYVYQPEAFLNSQNDRIFYTQSLSNDTVVDFEEIDLNIQGLRETELETSQTTKIGLGFGENKKWFLGIQHNLTKSANFTNNFFSRSTISYRDAKQWTVGGFYIPDYASFTSFWERVVYRFGFRTEQMSLIINNLPITETGLSFGIGLPLGSLSNANIGFEFIQRGAKQSGLIQETLIAMRIGLSLNDIWFIKRKYN